MSGPADTVATLLAGLSPAETAHLGACVASGRLWERAAPTRWILDPAPREAPGHWRAWQVGADRVAWGDGPSLYEPLLEALRASLAPYEGRRDVPDWVTVARMAEVAILAASPDP